MMDWVLDHHYPGLRPAWPSGERAVAVHDAGESVLQRAGLSLGAAARGAGREGR